jgi:hypothetical protein
VPYEHETTFKPSGENYTLFILLRQALIVFSYNPVFKFQITIIPEECPDIIICPFGEKATELTTL